MMKVDFVYRATDANLPDAVSHFNSRGETIIYTKKMIKDIGYLPRKFKKHQITL